MIKILGKKVLFEEIEQDMEKSNGGLYIPPTSQRKKSLTLGKVIGYGVDCQEVKEGDTVYVDTMAVSDIEVNKKPYKICEESHIFAVEKV